MFGYIRIRKSELRVREYEYYRAAYCGLCRSMGCCTGQCSRLTLSYDFAFLLLVRMALSGTEPVFRKRRCLAHPHHRRQMMEGNDQSDYCARAAALLCYEKCRDDISDERGFRRIRARMRRFFLYPAYRRAKKKLPELSVRIRDILSQLYVLESKRPVSADEPALLFGHLLAVIMSEALPPTAARIATVIGREAGRFIYLSDAVDDLDEDLKKGRYNPILVLYNGKPNHEEMQELYDAMIACLSDLGAALDLVNLKEGSECRAVLENILYLGMPETVRRVLYGTGSCKKEDNRDQ